MQLTKRRRPHKVREKIGALSAGLLAATIASPTQAQDASAADSFGPGVNYTELDTALLVYSEAGSRVSAIEPAATLTLHGSWGAQLGVEVVLDAVSGATPNGAVPSNLSQNFVTPVRIVTPGTSGGTTTVTGSSGGSTVITLPGSPGSVSYGTRTYTVAPNTLPVDKGFNDRREGFNLNWSQPLGALSDIGLGVGYSTEKDYRAITANAHVSQNLNTDNTTLSLALNGEFDSSSPYGGVPTPFTPMSGDWKKPAGKNKTQLGFVLGLTEVMSRHWLMQLNYSLDSQSGYQNDPYRILSVVDPVGGEPTAYLYENRPDHRLSHSLYWDNKFDFGPSVTDISLRYFTDDWGISSKTAELSERVDIGRAWYIEPSARWYQQSSANFFRNYLVQGQALPTYASSDSRLEAFTSLTFGMKLGVNLTGRTELYFRGGYYEQQGNGHPAGALGQLAHQNLFSGTNAVFGFVGYTWDFH